MKILKNILSHNFIGLINIIVPLITYPVIIRNLGLDVYGHYAYLIAIYTVISSICEYGFPFSGTRALSQASSNNEKRMVVSRVLFSKITIFFLFVPVSILFFILEKKYTVIEVTLASLIPLSEVFLMTWVYVTFQKVSIAASIISFFRLLAIPFLYFFVSDASEGINYLLIYTLTMLLISLYQFLDCRKRFGIRICLVSVEDIFSTLKSGFKIFIGRWFSFFKDRLILVWIGFFSSDTTLVGVFDILQKVLSLVMSPLYSISVVLFPIYSSKKSTRVSSDGITRMVKKTFAFSFILVFLAICFCFFSWIPLSYFGGNDLIAYQDQLSILIFSMPFLFISSIIGSCYLIANNKENVFNGSILASLLSLVFFLCVATKFDFLNVNSIVIFFLISCFIEMIVRLSPLLGFFSNEKK